MVKSRGAIPKLRKPIPRAAKSSRRMITTKANENDADISSDPCQICHIIDLQDLVQCYTCQLWFHLVCANVTSDIELHDWQCERCTELQKPLSNSRMDILAGPINLDNANVQHPIGNSTILPKAGSTTSSTGRKKALALQRVEEEKILRQQRDKQYLDSKYAILELDSSDTDVSFEEHELTVNKIERVKTWNQETQLMRAEMKKDEVKIKRTELGSNNSHRELEIPKILHANSSHVNMFPPSIVIGSTVQSTAANPPVNGGTTTSDDYVKKMLEIGHALDAVQFYNQTYQRGQQPLSQDNKLLSVSQTTSSTQTRPTSREITAKSGTMNIQKTETSSSLLNRPATLIQQSKISKSKTTQINNKKMQTLQSNQFPVSSTKQSLLASIQPVSKHQQLSGLYIQSIGSSNQNLSSNKPIVVPCQQPIATANQPFMQQPMATVHQPVLQQPIVTVNQPVMQQSVQQPFQRFMQMPITSSTFNSTYHQPEHSLYSQASNLNLHQHDLHARPIMQQPFQQPIVTVSQPFIQPPITLSQQSRQNERNITTATSPSFKSTYQHQPVKSSYGQSSQLNLNQHGLNTPDQGVNYNYNQNDLNVISPSITATHRSSRLTTEQIAARHIMPKDLPDFHGNPKDWLLFKTTYDNANDACGFTDAENLGRLLRCLKGEAKEAVRCRLLHKDSVPAVMRTLTMMFGRPELIVESWIEDIRNVPSPKDNDLPALIKYAIAVQNLCGTITETGVTEYLRNPTLTNFITDKLPVQIRLNWAYFKHSRPRANLTTLGDWLYELADVATQVVHRPSVTKSESKKRDPPKDSKNQNYINSHVECEPENQKDSSSNRKSRQCPVCKSDLCVKLVYCKKFKEISHKEKWSIIKENKLCSRCFGYHQISQCRSKQNCGVEGCKQKHNTLLHNHEKDRSTERWSEKPAESPKTGLPRTERHCNSHRSTNDRKSQEIFRIVPVVLYHDGTSLTSYAYLDDGSNLTTMEDSLANELGLTGTHEILCASWAFGETTADERSRRVSLKISGVFNQAPLYDLFNVRTVTQLHLPTQSITVDWLNQYKHLKNLPVATYESKKPRMIIGLRYSNLMVSLRTIEGEWKEPIACKTRLGWVIQGPNEIGVSNSTQKHYSMNMCECQGNDNQLQHLVKQFFSFESFGVKITDKILESKQIQRARQILELTTKRIDGRYETGLLWRHDEIELPNSYAMALKRLECLDRKLKKDPKLAEILHNQIQDFLEKGYVRKLRPEELQLEHPRIWYLPTFPVFNPKKPQKVRTVWDAAAKVKNVSLNSMLLAGPDQLNPLPDVLRRFREKEFAVTGDIKEMFHQVRVKEEDQLSQRFLWRDGNSNKKPDVYVMQVMTFGATCSPSAAQFVKNKNALEFKDKFPRAVEAITENHYIDDMLECADSVEEAVRLTNEVKAIHQKAGFEIRNFTSHSLEVLRKLGENADHQTKNLNITIELATERVLGMFWNTATDKFTFSLKFTKLPDDVLAGCRRPTKREILRAIMSIFDPLGLIAHFLVYGKILLQKIWKEGIDWDEQLPDSLYEHWLRWIKVLPKIEEIQIPRWYSPRMNSDKPKSIQLHIFVDASIEACSTVAYFRIEDVKGIDCCLIGGKTKVAPNKPMTVPRLELTAAVLGTRLAESINQSHRIQPVERFFWSDSQTVLGWINSEARKYHQFVAFRIGEILETSSVSEWHWIDTKNNVADDGTKWKNNPDFSSTSRWFKGSSFLYRPKSEWNFKKDQSQFTTDEEMRSVYVMAHMEIPKKDIIDPREFSCWRRLVRTLAYMLRFIDNLKIRKKDRKTGPLTRDEYIRSQNTLYQQAQRDHFMEEILTIRRNERLPIDEKKELQHSSVLKTCSPYLDENGILRVRGRIDAAKTLTYRTKRPIILPRRHHITRLIVHFTHRKYHHINHQTALNDVNQSFYIPAVRAVLKSVIQNMCQRCQNDKANPTIPEMAELPPARLATFTRAFTYVGIDYFGPMTVKVTRKVSAKRWGVLITCLTSRAVHIEIAHSLDTSSCIMAIENFAGIRGTPSEIYSDSGTNFKSAEKELRKEFEKLNKNRIEERFTDELTKWSFNPPKAAHMGGSWERLIGSIKAILEKSMPTRKPTDEMLKNFLNEAANVLNSRPLTYVQLDHVDDEVLTPNHLILGSANGRKAPGVFNPNNLLRDDWKAVQEMTNHFWRRFNIEYLPTLTRRTKWFKDVKSIEVGDIVIVIDDEHERNTWPKATVEEVFMGRDGKVRSARVRIIKATESAGRSEKLSKSDIKISQLVRPVAKLAVLNVKGPMLSSSPEAVNEEGYVVNAPSGHFETDDQINNHKSEVDNRAIGSEKKKEKVFKTTKVPLV